MTTQNNLNLFRTVAKVFGPEQAAFLIEPVAQRFEEVDNRISRFKEVMPFIAQEVLSVTIHLASIRPFIGLGCIGITTRLDSQDVAWLLPPSYSDAEAKIVRYAFQGWVLDDLKPIDLFLPIPIVLDPIAMDRSYIYIQRGLEKVLALFDLAGFPLYLVQSSAKQWYPYAVLRETEVISLPIGFVGFYKLVTKLGFIDPSQRSYIV